MTRRRKVLAAMLSCALAGSAALAASAPQSDAAQTRPAGKATARAHATLAGEGVSGTVEFVEMAYDTGNEVEITLTAKGLKPGLHGVHLHAVGKCEPPAFTAAGGHFDPGPAGNVDPDANHPFHMGDIPNLRVGADGSGTLQARTTRVTLSAGPVSLFDADGSAVIVHGNPDQGTTGEPKSGVSGGPRVACGAIEKK
ncbi:MAG TPA: superoxide dismutase family protein [Vicinamibacterales bacterium]|nr:superoxide dismutase family protein [Vicinamibacterales bacterium]